MCALASCCAASRASQIRRGVAQSSQPSSSSPRGTTPQLGSWRPRRASPPLFLHSPSASSPTATAGRALSPRVVCLRSSLLRPRPCSSSRQNVLRAFLHTSWARLWPSCACGAWLAVSSRARRRPSTPTLSPRASVPSGTSISSPRTFAPPLSGPSWLWLSSASLTTRGPSASCAPSSSSAWPLRCYALASCSPLETIGRSAPSRMRAHWMGCSSTLPALAVVSTPLSSTQWRRAPRERRPMRPHSSPR
mmetsp:Transcript_8067/g.22251  ORF Transcript_8067/g.22251 Transcript_8067/m.22251 type:complete len:249 (-) Transcript_8067:1024-1770(-)